VNYWKVIFATAVIFGAGVFTGGLLVNFVHQSYVHAASHHPSPPSVTNSVAVNPAAPRLPEVLSKPFLPKLDDQLHLSPEQHKNIEKIIADTQTQTRKLIQDTRQQIRAELTPDQRTQFDLLMKRPGGKRMGGTNAVESMVSSNLVPVAPAPSVTVTNQ
jgi:hypothetical protein